MYGQDSNSGFLTSALYLPHIRQETSLKQKTWGKDTEWTVEAPKKLGGKRRDNKTNAGSMSKSIKDQIQQSAV